MQGKVHVAIGVATVGMICLKYPTGFDFGGMHIMPMVALVTAAAGSYAPDVDNARTHAGQRHKVTSKVVSKVGGGHRGITHTLLFPAIVGVLMYVTNTYLVDLGALTTLIISLLFGFEAGWVMHIIADLFNGKGCPIFWPLTKQKVHILDLPSSGFVPWVFAIVFVFVAAFVFLGGVF